jgi:predicted DCC family thiol-disulfide oxidoreductase YuxK
MQTVAWPLAVFYDGNCLVCSREIDHYRTLNHAGRLQFVDISAPDFQADRDGPTSEQLQTRMHVRDAAGRYWSGVDAFPIIWQALPGRGYRCLARGVKLPLLYQLAKLGYALFARFRRYLPKTTRNCHTGHCELK